MDTNSLVPQSKSDMERARAAVQAGYPTVAPVLPQLFEWLRDCNWPVARVIAPLLASIGAPVIPHIRNILDSNDYTWKYYVLLYVVADSPEVAVAFRDDLERYAKTPTPNESAEELDEVAREILEGMTDTM